MMPQQHLPYHTIGSQARVNFLDRMYCCAKNQLGLVQVSEGPKIDHSGTYKVALATQGLDTSLKDEYQIQWMTACILSELAHLHESGFLHRDVRLPNILYIPPPTDSSNTVGTYVLIDFEHGGSANSATSSEDEMEVVDDPWLTQYIER